MTAWRGRPCSTWTTPALVLGAFIESVAVHSEEGTPLLTDADYWQTPARVLSVTQLAQPPAETPAAVTTITREEITASGARTIPELLRRVPGVTVAFENASNPVVNYQGLNSNLSARMQVLIDGRSVYNPFFGGVVWQSLPLEVEDIERIEFIRSPNAAIDGANAFLATISIFTRHAAEDRGFYSKVRAGNDAIRDAYLRHGGGQGSLNYRISGAYRADNGLDTRADDQHLRYLSGRADWDLGAAQHLTALAGFKDSDLGQGFATGQFNILQNPFEACFPPHTRHIRNVYGQLRYDLTPTPDQETTAQFYYERLESLAEYTRLTPCPGLAKKDDYLTERFDLELRHRFSLNENTRLIAGLGARQDQVDNQDSTTITRFVNRDHNNAARLFGHLEWRLSPDWLLNTGAMWEYNSLTGNAEFSPRLSLHYRVADHHTLRLGIARGIRSPSFVEADWTSEIIANVGDINEETSVASELAYLGEFPRYHLAFDVRYYYNRLSDLITLALSPEPGPPRVTYRNQGKADLQGLEAQLIWRPSPATRWALAYAYTTIDSENPEFAASNPRHIADVFLIHRFNDHWQGAVSFNYAGPMEWSTFGSAVPATRYWDLRLARTLTIGETPVTLALNLQNALGEQTTYRAINQFGRRLFLELAIGF
ncbi:MAG: TonB-dependent receptor [Gammaproteobacteria bacterium]|nr:TonB-dependent receptor [Gammaproteobacteria bacterium]MCP5460101.1 TonB-dependent receptor [Gammaproteobacteria bacterium]